LARCGDKFGLSRLVDQMSYSHLPIANGFADHPRRLSDGRLMELLTPLVPAIEERSSLEAWAAKVHEKMSELS
jgi:hypothetical protein